MHKVWIVTVVDFESVFRMNRTEVACFRKMKAYLNSIFLGDFFAPRLPLAHLVSCFARVSCERVCPLTHDLALSF